MVKNTAILIVYVVHRKNSKTRNSRSDLLMTTTYLISACGSEPVICFYSVKSSRHIILPVEKK